MILILPANQSRYSLIVVLPETCPLEPPWSPRLQTRPLYPPPDNITLYLQSWSHCYCWLICNTTRLLLSQPLVSCNISYLTKFSVVAIERFVMYISASRNFPILPGWGYNSIKFILSEHNGEKSRTSSRNLWEMNWTWSKLKTKW